MAPAQERNAWRIGIFARRFSGFAFVVMSGSRFYRDAHFGVRKRGRISPPLIPRTCRRNGETEPANPRASSCKLAGGKLRVLSCDGRFTKRYLESTSLADATCDLEQGCGNGELRAGAGRAMRAMRGVAKARAKGGAMGAAFSAVHQVTTKPLLTSSSLAPWPSPWMRRGLASPSLRPHLLRRRRPFASRRSPSAPPRH